MNDKSVGPIYAYIGGIYKPLAREIAEALGLPGGWHLYVGPTVVVGYPEGWRVTSVGGLAFRERVGRIPMIADVAPLSGETIGVIVRGPSGEAQEVPSAIPALVRGPDGRLRLDESQMINVEVSDA